jgi:hypothetical protein
LSQQAPRPGALQSLPQGAKQAPQRVRVSAG